MSNSKVNNALYTPLAIFGSLEQLIAKESVYAAPTNMKNDLQWASQFLITYQHNAETFKSFRREIERFSQWAWHFAKLPYSDLTPLDIENYLQFCQKPPNNWIANSNVSRFILCKGQSVQNLKWRPFVARNCIKKSDYRLSEKGLREIFTIINCFYNFLVQNDYVIKNPLKLIKQKNRFFKKVQTKRAIRRLSSLQWETVIETAELMASENPPKHERTLFVISLLYGLYLRISELVADDSWEPTMNDFAEDHDGNWWFTTLGKGNKEREIAVSDLVLKALERWREHLKCGTTLPLPSDHQPLVCARSPYQPITTTRQIRRIVQVCFDKTIERLKADGFLNDADALSQATVHWLRHTGISDDVKHRPREHVRDDAGHSSSVITDKYIDINRQERHYSARKKTIK